MWFSTCLFVILCCFQTCKCPLPSMPKELSKEIHNETEAEHMSCMEDFVICLRSHKILILNEDKIVKHDIPADIINNPPDINQNAEQVCAINRNNDVQQFDSVCSIVYTNCVLDKFGFWTYIGDGSCLKIMQEADAPTSTSPPEHTT